LFTTSKVFEKKGFEDSRGQGFKWLKQLKQPVTRNHKPETKRGKGAEAQRHKVKRLEAKGGRREAEGGRL
jgi:hypothetical protein